MFLVQAVTPVLGAGSTLRESFVAAGLPPLTLVAGLLANQVVEPQDGRLPIVLLHCSRPLAFFRRGVVNAVTGLGPASTSARIGVLIAT